MQDCGVLIAGSAREAAASAILLRKWLPDVPCYFWCEDSKHARRLDTTLRGNGWFNDLATALLDERIGLVVVASREEQQLLLAQAAISAGKPVAVMLTSEDERRTLFALDAGSVRRAIGIRPGHASRGP